MTDAANGLRRFADIVDAFDETPVDVDSARLLEAGDETLRGQLTVTVRDDDLDGFSATTEPDEQHEETDENDTLDHTVTEDLELAYEEADGNISKASERFEVGYGAVYRRMTDHGVHETESDENGTSTEDDTTESTPESEAPDVDLEEDAADDAPAGTGDDVQDDEITVDAVDDEKDDPDVALPDGVTAADVRSATENHEGLGDVAAELGITRGRARTITVSLGCYGDVRDIPGGESA